MLRLSVAIAVSSLLCFPCSARAQTLGAHDRTCGDFCSHTCDSCCCHGCDDCCCGASGSCCCDICGSCCCQGSIWTRDKLTGDWCGYRTSLAKCGIVIDSSLTQFYQGVAHGGNERVFKYGDKLDLYLLADTEKLGLWGGGQLQVHAVDWQFGQNIIGDAVGLAPVNTNLLTPRAEESIGLTTLLYQQQLGGGYVATVGRTSVLDLWSVLYPDYGRGIDGFMNMSLLLPMNGAPSLPVIQNLAGLLKVGQRGLEAAFVVIESNNPATTVGLDFPNEVTLAAIGRLNTSFGGLPGSHTILATYATGEYTSFDTSGWIIIPGGGVIPAQKSGTWMATYLGEQRLWVDPHNPKRYTKLFGKVGFSDVENSPFKCTWSISAEAFGVMNCRPNDRMGIGYFYNGLNDDFRELFVFGANPLENLHGGEVYYNVEITPWFHLTADLQVINPARQPNETAIVLGLRGKVDF
jgi:porin